MRPHVWKRFAFGASGTGPASFRPWESKRAGSRACGAFTDPLSSRVVIPFDHSPAAPAADPTATPPDAPMPVASIAGALRRALTVAALLAVGLAVPDASAQSREVRGTVTDQDAQPVPGVTVRVQGTSAGTTTDEGGAYRISVPGPESVLVFSFVGYLTQEVAVGAQREIDVVLAEDVAGIDDIVVTATRQPVRRLEATQAVDIIGPKQFEVTRPEGIAESVTGTPGVFTSSNQGRFRGSIFIRGFPDGSGNGLVYTGILLDGLPTGATTARPPDFAFGYDLGVERVEVVRGGSATLFGRASAAGAVNVITKTGGAEHTGTARTTYYNPNFDGADALNLRLDGNLNGPISETFRYNVSGYYLTDSGYRDLGYRDRGGQFRANVDWLSPNDNSSARLYGLVTDVTIQNMIDIPYRLDTFKPADGFEITDSFYFEELDDLTIDVTNRDGETETRDLGTANEEGNYATGGQIGLRTVADLGGGLTLSNNARFQSYDHGTKFNLGVSTFYFNDPNSAVVDPSGGRVPANFRILVDGDGNDTDFQDELRLSYALDAGASQHRISVGGFGSFASFTPDTYSLFFVADGRPDTFGAGNFSPLLNPGTGAPIIVNGRPIIVPTLTGAVSTNGSQSRVDSYTENVYAIFLGDEIEVGEDLSVNVGARYDWIDITLNGFYTERNPPFPGGPAPSEADNEQVIDRKETANDFSASLGVNYRFAERSAVFGNVTRSFRAPDYSAFSASVRGSNNPDSQFFIPSTDASRNPGGEAIIDNEVIYNGELGLRTAVAEFGLDAAAFYTFIDNRLATVYTETGVAQQRPFGSNQIAGFEVGGNWTPRAVPGLFARASFTFQDARFADFEIPIGTVDPDGDLFGNEVRQALDRDGNPATNADGSPVQVLDLEGNTLPRVPPILATLIVNYDAEYFGLNGLASLLEGGYFDATNVYENPTFLNVNLGAYGRLPVAGSAVRLGVLVKNALNQDDAYRFLYVADNSAALARRQTSPDGLDADGNPVLFTGLPQLPRRFLFTLQYEF